MFCFGKQITSTCFLFFSFSYLTGPSVILINKLLKDGVGFGVGLRARVKLWLGVGVCVKVFDWVKVEVAIIRKFQSQS